jgi:integrase
MEGNLEIVMPKKHTGVFLTPEGWRYHARINGRKIVRRAPSLEAAIAGRAALEAQKLAGTPAERTAMDSSTRVGRYLTAYAARPGLLPNTIATYDLYLKYLRATHSLLWTRELGDISTDDVSAAFLYLAKSYRGAQTGARLSPGTLDGIRRFVSSGFRSAVRKRILPYSPVADAEGMPKYRKPEPDPPNRAEMRAILGELAGHRLGKLFVVAAYCGLRVSEAVALTDASRKRDDEGRPMLWIHTAAKDRSPVHLATLGKPKGDKTRTIGLPRQAAAALEAAIEQRDDDARKAGERWAGSLGLVFATRHGTRLDPHYLNDLLQEAAERTGYRKPIAFHDLRRFAATAILESGGSMDDVGLVLGHTDSRVTARYTAATDARRAAIAERLAAWIEAPENGGSGTH